MAAGTSGYAAFISYSHAWDGKLAPTLQRELERFAKPWNRGRALRVFRDDDSLSANPDLWSSIERALGESEWFVLLASPTAARSRWVDQEVAWWLEHRSLDRVLVVLTAGELVWGQEGDLDQTATTALPPALSAVLRKEPRWVDVRWLRDVEQVDRSNPRLGECVADIAAAVRDVPKDLLVGEHIRQQRRTMRLARSAVTTLALLLVFVGIAAAVAVVQRNEARNQTAIAQQQRREALSRQLAAEALGARSTDPERAAMLALAGWQAVPGQRTAEARGALLSVRMQNYQGRFTGHSGVVSEAAISPNGSVVATGGEDHTVRLWDFDTHRELARLSVGSIVEQVAFSPDGTLLAGATDRELVLWEVPTGKRVAALRGIYSGVQFSPDGRTLAAGHADGSVRLIDVASRTERDRILGHQGIVWSVAFTPDGASVITGGEDHTVRRWNLATKQQTGLLTDHSKGVRQVTVSPDGRFMASTDNAVVRLWTLPDLVPWRAFTLTEGEPLAIGFNGDSSALVVGGGTSRTLSVFDVPHRMVLPDLARNVNSTAGLAFDRTGHHLVTTGPEGTVHAWLFRRHDLALHTHAVTQVAFDPTGRTVATSSGDKTARLWSTLTGDQQQVFIGHSEAVVGVAFSPDDGGSVLATTSLDHTLRLWDPHSGNEVGRLTADDQPLSDVTFSPNGDLLAAVTGNTATPTSTTKHAVAIWDARRRALRTIAEIGDQVAGGLQFSPDSTLLAAPLSDGSIRVWRTADFASPTDIQAGSEQVATVAFSPDGSLLAAAGRDGVIRLFDVATRRPVSTIGSSSGLRRVIFSPDGHTVASVGQERVVRLWNLDTRTLLAVLEGHADELNALAFSPDGRTLATAGVDSAMLWNLDTSAAERQLCQVMSGVPIDQVWMRLGSDHGSSPHC